MHRARLSACGAAEGEYQVSQRTKISRSKERGVYDRHTAHSILDEARSCTVAWSQDGRMYNLPNIHARESTESCCIATCCITSEQRPVSRSARTCTCMALYLARR